MAPTLDDLRARPDDRELLLVYGDWLESRGHPRGELIAVQDAEQHCTSVEQFERARARAVELVDAHAELRPDPFGPRGAALALRSSRSGDSTPIDDGRRRLWASWRGGFVRRLELLIDRPTPSPGEGLRAWSKLLAQVLAHPSLALLEDLLIRFDLRGEPLDESEAALTIVRDGLAAWVDEPNQGPPASLALWTHRVPTGDARQRLRASVPGRSAAWYSTDMTVVPPPRDSATTELEGALALLAPDSGRFDLVWLDALGRFRDIFGARPREIHPFGSIDPSLRMYVERMAKRRRTLASPDVLPQRRVTGIVDALAARLDTEVGELHPLVPRPLAEPRPAPLADESVLERLRLGWAIDTSVLGPALERFAGFEWWWIEDRCAGEPWTGVCGLADEQLLLLTRLER